MTDILSHLSRRGRAALGGVVLLAVAVGAVPARAQAPAVAVPETETGAAVV
jgi:hypothetical protein